LAHTGYIPADLNPGYAPAAEPVWTCYLATTDGELPPEPPAPDLTAPSIALTGCGSTIRTTQYTLVGTTDESLSSLLLEINDGTPIVATPSGLSFSIPLTLSIGRNVIKVTATDRADALNTSVTWCYVVVRLSELPNRSDRMLKLFPLGMRPR